MLTSLAVSCRFHDLPARLPAAALISQLVDGVSGTASLSCTTTGSCALKMAGLPITQIDVTCQAAECLPGGAAAPAPGACGAPGC